MDWPGIEPGPPKWEVRYKYNLKCDVVVHYEERAWSVHWNFGSVSTYDAVNSQKPKLRGRGIM
jgi:hypothetical protein